ncbi:hypothetical protein ACFLZN_02810, partial [Nanoarchaeota archaeon]
MKKSVCIWLTLIVALLSVGIFASIESHHNPDIQKQVDLIESSLLNNDVDSIINIISPNADPELRFEIQESLKGKNIYYFRQYGIQMFEEDANRVKVKSKFEASGAGWNIE